MSGALGGVTSKVKGLRGECEHILPIAQARYFLNLYSTSIKNKLLGEDTIYKDQNDPAFDEKWITWHIEAFKLEYDYAHSYCNQLKSSRSFIVRNPQGKGVVYGNAVESFLTEIAGNNTRSDGDNLQKQIKSKGFMAWYTERNQVLKKRYQAVIDLLYGTAQEDITNLIILAGMVNLIDEDSITGEFNEIIRAHSNTIRFIEHIRIEETMLLNNGQTLLPVISSYFKRTLLDLFHKQTNEVYKDKILESIGIIGSYIDTKYKHVQIEDTTATMTDENIGRILASLKSDLSDDLLGQFNKTEEFHPDTSNINNGASNMNIDMNLDMNLDSSNDAIRYLSKHIPEINNFIEIAQKPLQEFIYIFYGIVYKYVFTERREIDVPDIAEPVAIDVVILFFFKYILNVINLSENQRIRIFPAFTTQIKGVVDRMASLLLVHRSYLTDDFKYYLCKSKAEYLDVPIAKPKITDNFNKFCTMLQNKKRGGYRITRRQRSDNSKTRRRTTRSSYRRR